MSIKAINSSEQEVGRNIRSSKKKYLWKFSIDDADQEIVLLISSLSGKKEVRHNGRLIYQESSLFCEFRYLHKLQNCLVTIAPRHDSYQLYLNNIPFARYFNDGNSDQNENPKNGTFNNDDPDGVYTSSLKESEQQQSNFQQPLQKFRLSVPNKITNNNQNKTESKQQEIFWNQGVNQDFADFGTTQTKGTDNNFGNFGFTFDTPQKEIKNTNSQVAQLNNQKQNEKPNPFFEFGQNSWSAPQNNSNYGFIQQPSQVQVQQTKLFTSDIKPQTKTEQQVNNTPQPLNQTNQYILYNQSNLTNQQQQYIQLQLQQQQYNYQQQQLVNSSTIKPQISSQSDLLDFFECNQPTQNTINYSNQQQELKKSHSQAVIMPLQVQSQSTQMIFQSYQNPIQQNAFQNIQNYQFKSSFQQQFQSTYQNQRTTQSLTPLTSSFQQTKRQMPKELEDMFDQPMQPIQPPLQKRSTPFDDDLFT
ncbi:unnamed protein product (macronuclear) [Paramecium tetraurelia]|uniref:FHA domain-containing protein n=1 Tax=Paramecium tetraurelia TaxID=5888 RepID=A0BZ49_PARTE|nr:uncharacterized protein GSPATT00033669001 [Paramecium tetraurelia]CAK63816.1 unnamed protein product [Paramecium tetraurelia]|eukprot:XP_001431214.1 hypothetical protein (macronuclear) [Paramecium tetraurelia strain d4-2]